MAERTLADGPDLKPAYTVARGPVPGEESLAHLSGYPGGTDKIGNWVNLQFQLGALGEALQLFAAAAGHDHVDTGHWQAACGPPALFTEEYDTHQHQLRGNLPQSFVHAVMFESAARQARPWDAG